MKKLLGIILASLGMMIGLSGCNNSAQPQGELKPTSIEFATDVSNITYSLNMEFDYELDGVKRIPDLKVTYSDGQVKDILHTDERVSYAGYKSKVEGEQTIKVYFTDNNFTINSSYLVNVVNVGARITKQIGTVTVAYPEEATVSIEVEQKPDMLYLYEWQIIDFNKKGEVDYVRPIKTAVNTNTITLKSTRYHEEYTVRCLVNDGSEHITFSEPGYIRFSNYDDYKHVFYFAEHAILPGTTFDVQEHYPDDRGTISLNSDGNELTIQNVEFINDHYELDEYFYAFTFWYNCIDYSSEAFTINIVGQNFITNIYNNEGSSLLFNLKSVKYGTPDIVFTGTGELNLFGGAISILSNSNIVIDSTVNIHTGSYNGAVGINAADVIVNEGKKLSINSSIVGIDATNITLAENSEVNIDLFPAVGPSGTLPCFGLVGSNSVDIQKTKLNINININPCMYFDTRQPLKDSAGINGALITISNESTVNIDIVSSNHDLERTIDGLLYIEGISGIAGDQVGFSNSDINIKIDTPVCINASGLVGSRIQVLNEANVYIDVKAFGQVFGVSCLSTDEGDGFKVHNSYVSSTVDMYLYVGIPTFGFGVIAAQFDFNFENNISRGGVEAYNLDSRGGAGFAAFKDESHSKYEYDPSYEPILITYDGYKTLDDSLKANIASIKLGDSRYLVYETFYKQGMSKFEIVPTVTIVSPNYSL